MSPRARKDFPNLSPALLPFMHLRYSHPWNVSHAEAVAIQESLRSKLDFHNLCGRLRYVAGTDLSYSLRDDGAWAGVVLLSFPELEVVEIRGIQGTVQFPYVPGLLGFREIPLLLEALDATEIAPDIIICDGQGSAHPRNMGLASHLGVLTGIPTIGCAKRRLVGTYSPVDRKRGEFSLLLDGEKAVGAVLRTRTDINPVFVSPGYGVTLEESVRIILHCGGRYRIPEPLRQAHFLVNRLKKSQETV